MKFICVPPGGVSKQGYFFQCVGRPTWWTSNKSGAFLNFQNNPKFGCFTNFAEVNVWLSHTSQNGPTLPQEYLKVAPDTPKRKHGRTDAHTHARTHGHERF